VHAIDKLIATAAMAASARVSDVMGFPVAVPAK
jgi:hypothetical protein